MAATATWRHELPIEDVVTRYASLDIETSGVDPADSQLVAIGVGLYDHLNAEQSVDVFTYGAAGGCEQTLLRRAYDRINEFDPSALVTYNGTGFDLDYLQGRLDRLPFDCVPELSCMDHHVDLFLPRKQRASAVNRKWPSLEEVLSDHGFTIEPTEWRGEPLTNTVFGESLAPAYIRAVDGGAPGRVRELDRVIHPYTAGDVASNLALYEADAGRR